MNPVQRTPGGAHRIAAVSDEVAAGWAWSTGPGAQGKVLLSGLQLMRAGRIKTLNGQEREWAFSGTPQSLPMMAGLAMKDLPKGWVRLS